MQAIVQGYFAKTKTAEVSKNQLGDPSEKGIREDMSHWL
jgi:hypothetical protein